LLRSVVILVVEPFVVVTFVFLHRESFRQVEVNCSAAHDGQGEKERERLVDVLLAA
jgi:hypothetical protein